MANEFKTDVGAIVPKADAQKWIDKYDQEIRKDKEKDTKSVFYGKDIINYLFAQDGCTGISFFMGLKYSDHAKKDTVQLVLVGTKEDGTLIWPDDAVAGKDGGLGGAGAADTGSVCPPYCPHP